MKKLELDQVLSKIKRACLECEVNLVIVGSVAYRKDDDISGCDDLDCVIIYDNINKLDKFKYIDKIFYNSAVDALHEEEVDLFATKLRIDGIKVSLDFISINYFEELAKRVPEGKSYMLYKMTDAEELPMNDYYSLLGEQFIYIKEKYKNRNFNVYVLPQFLYHNNEFFSGVLYNKFIHNPQMVVVVNSEIIELHRELVSNYVQYYVTMKGKLPQINILLSIRNWEKFSAQSKKFIYDSFNIQEEPTI